MSNQINKINFEAEKPVLDGRHIDRLIELWLEEAQRKVKPRTLTNKKSYMRLFLNW